ncbi:FAD:protein FMN transferase [uncultured Shewanella sp.]|uniref:FAD:protein FMN transferase n=1 Tax=uncultured Shewanella sp. TaxID=173975 RepID=UPI002638A324|nr:FAD:protein FMN transferase [uncultured Shewanella sp.]
MNRLFKLSLYSLFTVLATSVSNMAMANSTSAQQETFKPYLCEGNGIITHKDGVSTLNTLKYFGTSITIDLYNSEPIAAEQALCHALNVVQEYHYLASNYSTYPHVVNIKSINNNPTQTHKIDPKLTALIAAGLEWYSKSDGYFNIALSPVIDLWRKHRSNCKGELKEKNLCTKPEEQALINAAQYTDVNDIQLNQKENTLQLKAGMSIDLGGIAKGWMTEKVYQQLKSDGLSSFLINAGGNIRHYGIHPQGREFTTAIEDPICKKHDYQLAKCKSLEGQYHEIVRGRDLTIVSSGNYLRYYKVKDREYHHLIDPKTLQPKPEGISTSVVLDGEQIFADVISTTLFLMPLQQALDFANKNNYVEAVWYLDETGKKINSNHFDKFRLEMEN